MINPSWMLRKHTCGFLDGDRLRYLGAIQVCECKCALFCELGVLEEAVEVLEVVVLVKLDETDVLFIL